MRATSVLRHSPWDGLLVALSFAHAAALIFFPSVWLIAIALWWNANTISHNFIHLPFFRARKLNSVYGLFLTALLGFPQSLWRARHLAHHAGREDTPMKWTSRMAAEVTLVILVWTMIAIANPKFYLVTYLPGYLAGLALCQIQGYFEHAHGTTSHYGRIYNVLFFRDGLHAEHHAKPSTHWRHLEPAAAPASSWPPVLRWLGEVPASLDWLERVVLRSSVLQSLVIRSHQRAIARALAGLPEIQSVVIIGGGLFPRTAIIMRQLFPSASITIIDRDQEHLKCARRFLGASIATVARDCDAFFTSDADLVVVPLAFVGDRNAFYAHPPAPIVLIHDWIWRRRGEGKRVSWWLLKRVNVVRRASRSARPTRVRRAA